MITPSLTNKDGELSILVNFVRRAGSFALMPISGYARYEWARWMIVFGTRRTGNYAIIFDECVNSGRPEHHLLTRDHPATYTMADPGDTNVYASNSFGSFRISLLSADLRVCQLQESVLASVGVLLSTFFM